LDPVQEVTSIDLTSRMFKLQTLSNSHWYKATDTKRIYRSFGGFCFLN
jgi:hypothetical protein